jgi:predicted cupin superfamily sugar epimerase
VDITAAIGYDYPPERNFMMNRYTTRQIIDHFNMQPLPQEGGWYVETYRAAESIVRAGLDIRYNGDRCHSTAILYLLTAETCSKMHCVKSDEIFHYHLGDPIKMLQLYPDGSSRDIILGPNILTGHQVQAVVPHGVWQGAKLRDGGQWCLTSCTVAPGFEFEDYEHGKWDELIRRWPDRKKEIQELM